MTKEEKEFMEKHFKAGEYTMLTIMVNNNELSKLMEYLKAGNLNMAILPTVKAGLDFASDDKGTEQ
jgi:hypothetical protein